MKLECPQCGNTRSWATLEVGDQGARGTCGVCGGHVTTSAPAPGSGGFTISGLDVRGPATFGSGNTMNTGGGHRPATAPYYVTENGQRYLVDGDRRWVVNEYAVQPGGPLDSNAGSPVQNPAPGGPPGSPWADQGPPSASSPPAPDRSAPPARPAEPARPAGPSAAATAPGGASGPAAVPGVPTEVTGLISAQHYASGMSQALNSHASVIDNFVGVLRGSQVSGDAIDSAIRAQDLTLQAAQAWSDANAALHRQDAVRDAYTATPEAGSKEFLQEG